MILPINEIKKRLKENENFEDLWIEYSNIYPDNTRKIPLEKSIGKPHPVIDLIYRIREALLSLGFTEVINPIFISTEDVYKQYGPEAPVILDRIYFLAGLPRPDIGLSTEYINRIKKEVGEIDFITLKNVLRKYREREIEADELLEVLKKELKITDKQCLRLISILKDFFDLKPTPLATTLRSHMTASWFITLSHILEYLDPPLRLFSIDWVFRREQRVDKNHLRYYHSASIVVVDENLSVNASIELTKTILNKIGLNKIKIVKKQDTSRYYAYNREFEIYVELRGKMHEIGTFGLYSPIALANYDIPYPVYNFGLGVERLAQVIYNTEDIRVLVFPYLYSVISDQDIASRIKPILSPSTEYGKQIEKILLSNIEKYRSKAGPFKVHIYSDEKIDIYLYEPDPKPYAGPATFNKIYVHNGNIISSVEDHEGIYVGRYIDFIVKKFAKLIEDRKTGWMRVRWVEGPADANIKISPKIMKYIHEKNRTIDIKGPVFVDIIVEKKSS